MILMKKGVKMTKQITLYQFTENYAHCIIRYHIVTGNVGIGLDYICPDKEWKKKWYVEQVKKNPNYKKESYARQKELHPNFCKENYARTLELHPNFCKEQRARQKKLHPNCNKEAYARQKELHPEYYKALNAKRKRNMDFIRLFPNMFPVEVRIAGHHIDNTFVISVPEQVHLRNLGKHHREKMNPIAFSYYHNYFMQQMYKVLFKDIKFCN